VKYRYYLSSTLLNGEAERTGAVSRVPAATLEAVVIGSVRQHLKLPAAMDDYSLIEAHIARVEVHPERLPREEFDLHQENIVTRTYGSRA
jgi:hypothetical protein